MGLLVYFVLEDCVFDLIKKFYGILSQGTNVSSRDMFCIFMMQTIFSRKNSRYPWEDELNNDKYFGVDI